MALGKDGHQGEVKAKGGLSDQTHIKPLDGWSPEWVHRRRLLADEPFNCARLEFHNSNYEALIISQSSTKLNQSGTENGMADVAIRERRDVTAFGAFLRRDYGENRTMATKSEPDYSFITDRLAVGNVESRRVPGFIAVVSLLATSPYDELYGAPAVPFGGAVGRGMPEATRACDWSLQPLPSGARVSRTGRRWSRRSTARAAVATYVKRSWLVIAAPR